MFSWLVSRFAAEDRGETHSKHMVGHVSNSGVEKKNGRDEGNEGKSAAYDTESNPAISCMLSQLCSALSIYGNGICMKGKLKLMDQGLVLGFFCIISGKRSGPVVL